MTGNRSPGTYLIGIGLVVLGGIGFTIVNLRGGPPGEGIERWRFILGWSLVIWASAFLLFFLISLWAYGAAKRIRRERPAAIIVRSGSSPAFKSVLESSEPLRKALARGRPPFMQFLVVFDVDDIQIWHGSGRGALTGSVERTSIERVSVGRTSDGIWPFNTIDIDVATEDGVHTISFVVRGPTGYLTASKRNVAHLAHDVAALYSLSAKI
ncbi:hypothetical protein N1031_03340 [Herbiconiux moechotypicola]|nr:hypothetical protein [Herbiconiux moechotypicola]MCS5728783.1 hypothetical protein [Herbiconiux moechotypicola]